MKKYLITAVMMAFCLQGFCFFGIIYKELKEGIKNAADKLETLDDLQELARLATLVQRLACQESMYNDYIAHLEFKYGDGCFFKSDVLIMDYKLSFAERAVMGAAQTLLNDQKTSQTQKTIAVTELSNMVQDVLNDLKKLNSSLGKEVAANAFRENINKSSMNTYKATVSFNLYSR